MEKIKIKDLKNLPRREWGATTIYNSLIVINSGRKHDSGYALMYIVGIKDSKPVEIAAACDDINWKMNGLNFRNDMYYPSGAIHFWGNEVRFRVGYSSSSTDVELIELPKEELMKVKELIVKLQEKDFIEAVNFLHSMIDQDKLKIAEEKAFQKLKVAYPDFIKRCNLLAE